MALEMITQKMDITPQMEAILRKLHLDVNKQCVLYQ